MDFNIDNKIKNDYLQTKPKPTAYSQSFVLKLIDDYESINKKVYNMSRSELEEMISIQFNNYSWETITTNISIGRKYIEYCISKNLVADKQNRLTFTKEELQKFASKQVLENKYISHEQLEEYQNKLFNNQDKLLLELPYIGIKGKGNEEIINLKINLKNQKNVLNLLKNNGNSRELFVSDKIMKLVEDTYNDEYYSSSNGGVSDSLIGGVKKAFINKVDDYVFRVPSSGKIQQFTAALINLRMTKIQQLLGNDDLTIKSLYMSGMIAKAIKIITEEGSIDIDDYVDICKKHGYINDKYEKQNPYRLRREVNQILKIYELEINHQFYEGNIKWKYHKSIERNASLIKKAKMDFVNNNGSLFCEVCKFDFSLNYKERGTNFIEGHHKKPLKDLKENGITKVEDIAMLCSNCHRMIHKLPIITMEELKELIKK